jgi:hypothetical protein
VVVFSLAVGTVLDAALSKYQGKNRDDQGGYAPKEKITEALQHLGLMPTVVIEGTTP